MSAPSTFDATHPRHVLFDAGEAAPLLPTCDHYAGTELLMRKSLALQQAMGNVFDLTLDCEDGAPVGGEAEHAHMVAELAFAQQRPGPGEAAAHNEKSPVSSADASLEPGRVGARVHAPSHPAFFDDVKTLLSKRADHGLAYVMVPKVRDLAEVEAICTEIDRQCALGAGASGLEPEAHQRDLRKAVPTKRIDDTVPRYGEEITTTLEPFFAGPNQVPIHVLIETHGALRDVQAIAAHPRVEVLAFGLMDFVSAHRGAIPASAMSAQGQFSHPLVVRAKLEIAAACHAHGKTPSHCVVTEFQSLRAAALRAATELGYLRMWSIHPRQIRPIVEAFAPSAAETEHALEIIRAAQAASWAPIRYASSGGPEHLHDRASYRYYWQVIERARRTGQALPAWALEAWFGSINHLGKEDKCPYNTHCEH
jgi:citrate lyase subunit beta / citryl-CoA lyase